MSLPIAFWQKLPEKNSAQLYEMLEHAADYEPEAIEAALAELARRDLSLKVRQAESQAKEEPKPLLTKTPSQSIATSLNWSALPESDKSHPDPKPVEWFYFFNETTIGPVSEAHMHQLIQAKFLSFSSLIWCSGLSTWVTLENSSLRNAMASTAPPPPISIAAMPPRPETTNENEMAPITSNTVKHLLTKECEESIGLNRVGFIFTFVAINVVCLIIALVLANIRIELKAGVILLGFSCLIITTYYRLKNMRGPKWTAFGIILPLANLVLLFMCLVFPPNYYPSKELDQAGKLLALASILLVFVGATAIVLNSL